jgi:GNAT superfamily N-acetyltransferase
VAGKGLAATDLQTLAFPFAEEKAMGRVTVRTATVADVPAMRRVLVETWHATYDALYGPDRVTAITDEWHAEARLAAGLERADHRVLVACDRDGAVFGTAAVTLVAPGRLGLDRLYVRPGQQGTGVGTALLAGVLAGWPGLRRIDLEVEPRNAPAIAFYRRHGFLPAAAGRCGGVTTSLVMRRHVPPDGMSIRPAAADDAPAILGTIVAAIEGSAAPDDGPEAIAFLVREMSGPVVAARLAQWDTWVVTDREGTVCGTASFDGSRVRMVFVAPAWQRQGLGSVLMDAVERAALDAGCDRLSVRSSPGAVAFYAARGFIAGETLSWGPAPMVAMERPFDPGPPPPQPCIQTDA